MFKCNNCDVEAPIEELRVEEVNPGRFLKYRTGSYDGQRRRLEYPARYQEILFCDRCKPLYKQWLKDHRVGHEPSRLYRETVQLLPIANWCRVQLRKAHVESEKSRLSLERWEIPLSAEHRQIIAPA